MVTKELVKAEIETLNDEQINEIYGFIQDLKTPKEKKSLMETLMDIKIDAPKDFAVNHDLYLSKEKDASSLR